MEPTETLSTLKEFGITVQANGDKLVMTPGSRVPATLVPEIQELNAELLALICQPNASTCGSLPSIKDAGHLAHAGVEPAYIV